MKKYSQLLQDYFLPDAVELTGPVICRFDMNTAVNGKGFPEDSPKFYNCAHTLKKYTKKFPEAKWVVLTHQGRKGGKECVSTLMHAEILRNYGLNVRFCNEAPYGDRVQNEAKALQPGGVLLLENTRFPNLWEWEKGLRGNYEKQMNHPITKTLAEVADCYINDAYETAHRGDASVTGLALYFHKEEGKKAYLGDHVKTEVSKIERLKKRINCCSGVSLYAGGAKFKLKYHGELMKRFPQMRLYTGGIPGQATAIAAGYHLNEENESIIKNNFNKNIEKAKKLLDEYGEHRILHPIDWFVETKTGKLKSVNLDEIPNAEGIIRDIGPKTVAKYTRASSDVNLLAGPPGMSDEGYSFGTHGLLYGLQMQGDHLWVLGGHGATALPKGRELEEMKERIEYMSAGGAALTHLSCQKMPLFDVLIDQASKE
ncbi:MAG: phosphoglycerate kinase [Candidatus Korarchaeota archaeon]|nr:phosphoglycerate kinase [Candidatus Korarchaeota archaeon]NIU83853.1 phosphoglycerate kinase [Candidatus Thorarchaeota archaeon]NIW13995.1 phosphoglycerate kinase [Candidatus Thorarchaeota archaeon]NIW53611.1 phosphoglycerate kinase [Candidatus Korarchaeota archaeon]